MMGKEMAYLFYYTTFILKFDESEVVTRSLIFGHDRISSLLRQGRCCKTSENDSTSVKLKRSRISRDGGRRKDDDGVVVLFTSSATANETTPEFSPYNLSTASEVGKFCSPHSDMGLFKPPIHNNLKLGGHDPQGK
ncbi:hypothetical protein L1887_18142 [Cichorium endivia]|nr:hypothetical protein L1887_18142 [Cichorium endivia]